VMPHRFVLEFTLPLVLLHDWQAWVNSFAYDYFTMPMTSWFSSPSTRPTMHNVRFTSTLDMNFEGKRIVRVRVEAELSPSQPPAASPLDETLATNWQAPPEGGPP